MSDVDKIEELIAFAWKTEDPNALVHSLVYHLGAIINKNNKNFT